MAESSRTYLPAAGRDWLLPFYDPFVRLLGGEASRRALVEQANLAPGQRVLEVGCGTGTLAVMIKRRFPGIDVTGIDPDPRAVGRARQKAQRTALSIRFDEGFGDALSYPEASFDRVFSSFMFHHLPAEEKGKFLREVRRILKPDGSFHMLDFEEHGGVHSFLARLLHASDRLKDQGEERIKALMSDAGFTKVDVVGRRTMLVGPVAYYRSSVER
jgi:ubiquinone/menaquinone biosynthesis C-methylase UbiE